MLCTEIEFTLYRHGSIYIAYRKLVNSVYKNCMLFVRVQVVLGES